jgi:hypothetical protein
VTWTWQEIIRLALFRSGVLGKGQIPSPVEFTEGMDCLKLLLDEWDGKGLALPDFSTDIVFPCVPGQEKYLLGVGPGSAFATRPEAIMTARIKISDGPPAVFFQVDPISFTDYRKIPVPSTPSQPTSYAVNEKYPRMEVYLYPSPSQAYSVSLTCKVKWISTLGIPSLYPWNVEALGLNEDVLGNPPDQVFGSLMVNPFAVAATPSGYTTALVDSLALKIAQNNRLETQTLVSKANSALSMMVANLAGQKKDLPAQGIDAYPWDLVRAGIR